MKRLLLILAFLLTFAVHAQDNLQLADDAYRSGDYAAAISLYETALLSETSGELYFNLGNAYYEMGQSGLALYNYRWAEVYLPRDEVVKAQISRIRGERLDIAGDESDWLNITAQVTGDVLSVYELSLIVFVVWVIFFVLLAIGWKCGWKAPIASVGIILFISLFLLGSRLYVETQRPDAVLLVDSVQVMSGPGEDYLPLYVLYEAAEFKILETRNNWIRFALADGRQGWIRAVYAGFIASHLG